MTGRRAISPDQVPHLRAAGAHLRAARVAAGLTITQVALGVGVSESSVTRTEGGLKRTKRATFERYAATIGRPALAAELVRLAGPGLSDAQDRRDHDHPSPEARRALRNLGRPDSTPQEIDEAVVVITKDMPRGLAERFAGSIRRVREDVVTEAERAERRGNADPVDSPAEPAGQLASRAIAAITDRPGCAT